MHYDTLGTIVLPDTDRLADQLEAMIPSFTYRQLVESLPQLAGRGVLAEGSLPTMLVVVRLVDRRRILDSGITSLELQWALDEYLRASNGKPALAVESALEQAIRLVNPLRPPALENKAQAPAYAAR